MNNFNLTMQDLSLKLLNTNYLILGITYKLSYIIRDDVWDKLCNDTNTANSAFSF